jgi:hypothetical protein
VGLDKINGLSLGPLVDELEVTLLGPGWGECVLVHLGGRVWTIIDSCLDNSAPDRPPAALSYLEALHIDIKAEVKLIMCTHWHDDHIAGLSEIVKHCPKAAFWCSGAFRHQEFSQMIRAYQKGPMIAAGSGVSEIDRIFALLREGSRPAKLAIQDRLVFRLLGDESGHGHECVVWSLSPSDKQIGKFLAALGFPNPYETKGRCHSMRPNHQTVALWMEIGETKILLGGDLEDTGDQESGWAAIVGSTTRPDGQAAIFKIPHHGSRNGHNDCVWSDMLVGEPLAILTPWNRGSKLPTPGDVKRIVGLTPNAYSTPAMDVGRPKRRPPPVEKTLRELGVNVRPAEPRTGLLRLRKRVLEPWRLECFGGACHLSKVHPQRERWTR